MAEGGKEPYEGGITEDEERLLQALHLLGIKPRIGSIEDVSKLLQAFGGVKQEHEEQKPESSRFTYQFPRLSLFYGEDGKGDVNWDGFRYEIEALLRDKVFTDEQILLGIRRSCKGKAGDKIRRLGPDVSVQEMLLKFDSDYGSVESREMIMKKFYCCQQKEDESLISYASRLEEIFDKAVQLEALRRSDFNVLKELFHSGLRKDLKLMSLYQFDKIQDYDEFKREIRKIESSMEESSSTDHKKACKAAVTIDSHTKDITEIKDLLMKLNERMDKFEKEKETEITQQNQGFWNNNRGKGRGYRGRNRGRGFRGRGRGDFRQQRPISSQNFQPTCWTCNERGHVQRNCPSNNSNVICYNCQEHGHKQINCPKA